MKSSTSGSFVLCLKNEGYEVSLEPRKVYRRLPDAQAESKSLLRIIDESGEDYLFPKEFFVPIQVPRAAAVVFPIVT